MRFKAGEVRIIGICAAVLVIGTSLYSCNGGIRQNDISFDPTPVISKGIGWIMIHVSLVRLKKEPAYSAEDMGFVHRKEIFEVVARVRKDDVADSGTWYKIDSSNGSGWLHESSVGLFDTKARATKAQEITP